MCNLKELNQKLENSNLGDWISRKYGIQKKYFVWLVTDLIITCCGGTALLFSSYIAIHDFGKSNGIDIIFSGTMVALSLFILLMGLVDIPRDSSKRFVGRRLDSKIEEGLITKEVGIQLDKDYDLGYLLITTLYNQKQTPVHNFESVEIQKDHNTSEAEHVV